MARYILENPGNSGSGLEQVNAILGTHTAARVPPLLNTKLATIRSRGSVPGPWDIKAPPPDSPDTTWTHE